MKVLVVGGGGREHSLVWKLNQSPRVTKVYCAPGNAGIAREAEVVPIQVTDIEALVDFARGEEIGLTCVGPELLTGSMRLKAGTATKILLNILSTMAMVGLGKVFSNWMVDLNPSNTKLRDRACRVVQAITGCARSEAEDALRAKRWVVREALRKLGGLGERKRHRPIKGERSRSVRR